MIQEQNHFNILPVQVFWGWAEGDHQGDPGLWDAARGAVLSDVDGDQCGRPAAAGDGDDREGDYVDDVYDVVDYGEDEDDDGDVVVLDQDWSNPNEAPPHLLSKKRWVRPAALTLILLLNHNICSY